MRHHLLHFARMLGGAVHAHAAVFQWHGIRDLAFQIELLLPTLYEAALQPMRRGGGGARPRAPPPPPAHPARAAPAAPPPTPAPAPAPRRRADPVIEDVDPARTDSDTPDAPSRLWLGAGAAASRAAGGLGLVPHAMLSARFEPTSRWGLSLDAFVPLAAGEIEGGEGSARSSWYALIAGVELSLLRRAPWFASLGIGGGVLMLDVSAEGRAGFSARDDRLYAGAAQLGLSAGWHLAERLRLRADAHTGLSGPRPVLRFDGREVASLGRWYGGIGLTLEGALQLGAEATP